MPFSGTCSRPLAYRPASRISRSCGTREIPRSANSRLGLQQACMCTRDVALRCSLHRSLTSFFLIFLLVVTLLQKQRERRFVQSVAQHEAISNLILSPALLLLLSPSRLRPPRSPIYRERAQYHRVRNTRLHIRVYSPLPPPVPLPLFLNLTP